MTNPLNENAGETPTTFEVKSFHMTTVAYPCPTVFDQSPANGDYVLFNVHRSQDRYEPIPLIPDAAVTAHTSRYNYPETTFFSITPASLQIRDVEASMPYLSSVSDRLVRDMEFVETCMGRTRLMINTFRLRPQAPNPTGPLLVVRIDRKTMFLFAGARVEDEATYEIGLRQLQSLDRNALWLRNVLDLVHRSSDRAVLNVALTLERYRVETEDLDWKPRRLPKYEDIMSRASWSRDPAALCEPEEKCAVCRELLSEGKTVSHCPANHMYHFDCLLQVCRHEGVEGPEKARCPLCRKTYFTDAADLEHLKFGIVDKKYQYDERFNSWENFVRSCADIDKHLAEDSTEIITCNKTVIQAACDIIIDGAGKEPSSSTPYHLQPARNPQLHLFRQGLEDGLERFHGWEVEVKSLYDILLADVLAAFTRAYQNSDLVQILTAEELRNGRRDPERAGREAMRPGLLEFVERTLSRAFEFQRLRACKCTDTALHLHGIKAYFNPEDPNWSVSKRYSVLKAEYAASLAERTKAAVQKGGVHEE